MQLEETLVIFPHETHLCLNPPLEWWPRYHIADNTNFTRCGLPIMLSSHPTFLHFGDLPTAWPKYNYGTMHEPCVTARWPSVH